MPTIGIYSIFIDSYICFYENFINNMETNFLSDHTKYYYIVTNNYDIKKLNNRTFFIYTEQLAWPYPTLYRFKYFLLFPYNLLKKSNIMFFINSNAICVDKVNDDILPNKDGHVFTTHCSHAITDYDKSPFDKNINSTAGVSYEIDKNYYYYGGRFYGADLEKFIQLCTQLDRNIDIDEKNNVIALWHDESHINYYCNIILNNNFKKLGVEYHIPEEALWKYSLRKIIYLDKNKYIQKMLKNKVNDVTSGTVIPNRYNS
jgi:hypothetical protein